MIVKGLSETISSLRIRGVKFDYKNHSDNETTNVDVYEELNSLYDDYKKQLYTEEPLQVNVQMNFDMIQYTAVWLGKRNTPDSLSYQNAVRQFFIDRMKKNDYSILDTIILNNKNYIFLIFNDKESLKVVSDFFDNCKDKFEELKAKYEAKTISKEESDLLIKMLMNTLFTSKYPELKAELLTDVYVKTALTKTESEFLSREVAHWKAERKNMPYTKPYIIEMDEKGELPSYGAVHCEGVIFINYNETKKVSDDLIWTALHEYEHYIQDIEYKKGILTSNSLAMLIHKIIRYNNPEEYHRNYQNKEIELFANARAKTESMIFKAQKIGHKAFEMKRPEMFSSSSYRYSIEFGYQTDEQNESYTVNAFNMQEIERILQEDERISEHDKLILTIYNKKQKRLKNIFELSDEYVKQPIEGKEALSPAVEYQILKGDLNNIDFNLMSKEEITNVLLLLSRQLKNTMTRLYIYVEKYHINPNTKKEQIAKTDNLEEIILILKNEMTFIRNNLETIKKFVDDWPNYLDEDNIKIEMYDHADQPVRMDNYSARINLGTQSNNPMLFMERFSNGNIVEMLRDNENYKHLSSNRKEVVEEVFQKIRTELDFTDDYGGINI